VRVRLDAVAAQVPARRVLSEGAVEVDPEEDAAPEGEASARE
jgi:hypothetical protein